MAGRGRGGKHLLVQALQRLKAEEERQAREAEEARQRELQPPPAPLVQKEPEPSSDSEASTPASGQSEASAAQSEASEPQSGPPSEAQSEASGAQSAASDSESNASGDEASGLQPKGRPDSPTRDKEIRGKFSKYLVRRTPPDSPVSSVASESEDSSAQTSESASASQSSAPSEAGDSPQASGTHSPVPSNASGDSASTDGAKAAPLKPIDKKGVDGEKLKVAVNFMKISVKSKKQIHLYAVFFEPNLDSLSLRRRILQSPEVIETIGDTYNFTGTNLFLPHRLENDPCIIQTTHPTLDTPVILTITHVKIPPTEELANFYNNLFNKVMRAMKLVELNLHHYNPEGKIAVPQHKLEVWPGYVCAIQEYDGGLMLNVDTSHRVLRQKTAREMLHELFTRNSSTFASEASKLLVGAIVLTRYNNRAYRIDDIDFSRTPSSKFEMKEGQEITFMDYFRQQWGITIKDPKQPLLLHRPRPRRNQTEESPLICLIPELSYLTGLTNDIRADHRVMKDLANHTKISPEAKHKRLVEFINSANTNPASKKVLTDWGVDIDPQPFETIARKFPQEKVIFGGGAEFPTGDKAEWGMRCKDNAIIASKPVKRWYFFYSGRDRAKAEEFCKTLQQVSRKLGFSFDTPRRQEIGDFAKGNEYRKVLGQIDRSAELVVIMTPGSAQTEERYAAIKQMCCVELGIPSQVIRSSTLTPNKFRSVCVNVAMQIACKQGGQLWSVAMPLNATMYVGLDSYHDPSNKARSVVGVVASLNKNATQWYSRCYFQQRHEEIVSALGAAMVAAVRKWSEVNNGALPSKIFIYRDGVGDGDLPTVRDYEVATMEESIENFIKTKPEAVKPLITYVVVQKRVNVKLMHLSGRTMLNPPPGTVIDHTVTRRQFYDFYLISQHVHQGTVTPTHYIAILDQCNLGPDKLQRLTYKMTHLYYNFPATIRVPAPCQYAHKLAFLMGQYVQTQPNEVLHDKLFYL